MSHGLKSIAQELSQYGRNGDTMIAHINPQEAEMLKAMGGSGTINPHTGLPEFGMFGIGGGGGILGTGINKSASDPISNALSNNPISQGVSNLVQSGAGAIDRGLVDLDKTVGKAIPGGWGTVGMIAGSAMGLPTAAMVGLGALNGSGVMHKGGKFNLQGAIMGGAMAYGMSELGEYMRAAGTPTVDPATGVLTTPPTNVTPQFGSIEEALPNNYAPMPEPTGYTAGQNGIMQPTFDASAPVVEPPVTPPSAPPANAYQPPAFDPNYDPNAGIRQPISDSLARGDIGDAIKTAANDVSNSVTGAYDSAKEGLSNLGTKASNAYDTVTNPKTYTEALDKGMSNASQTGSGIKNLLTGSANPAAAAAVKAGAIMSPMLATGMTLYGGMGLSALDEQRKYLQDQANAGAISNAQYQQEMADIERQADIARKAVAAHPLQSSSNINDISEGPSLYSKNGSSDTLYNKSGATDRLYAMGGTVSNPPDDQTGVPTQSPMTNFMPNLPRYTKSLAEENAAMQANQAAGIQTMGGIGQASSNPLSNIAQASAPQGTGSSPQTYYGGSQLGGGLGSFNGNQSAFPLEGQYGIVKMAAGGMAPRFLSGGGDGMSDSIHATINDKQEARLADGEFVIPADVVSHLGNGSSKAGAKQLYSMMDRVRQARTGRKSQGKQINARKFMVA